MERGFGFGWVSDTLLGPEGSDPHAGVQLVRGALFLLGVGPPEPVLGTGGGGCRLCFENFTVDASIFVAQVFKGTRWMPWHQEPKKDVGICDKPRVADNQAVIRGFPNGETRLEASPVTRT